MDKTYLWCTWAWFCTETWYSPSYWRTPQTEIIITMSKPGLQTVIVRVECSCLWVECSCLWCFRWNIMASESELLHKLLVHFPSRVWVIHTCHVKSHPLMQNSRRSYRSFLHTAKLVVDNKVRMKSESQGGTYRYISPFRGGPQYLCVFFYVAYCF